MAEIKCPSCGSQNIEQTDMDKYECPYCGKIFSSRDIVSQQPQTIINQNSSFDVDDNPGCLMNGVCFLIPIVGLILYFVKKEKYPKCAKSYLIWAAVGFGFDIILNLSEFWDAFWEGFYSV